MKVPVVRQDDVYKALTEDGFKRVVVHNVKYDMVYGIINAAGVVGPIRCIPHKGYSLFEVSGKYVNGRKKPVSNYFLARSKKEAKQEYYDLYGWGASQCFLIPPGEEADEILTNRLKMPL